MTGTIADMSKKSKSLAQNSLKTSKIIWIIQSLSPIIYTIVALVLAEQNGGIQQWQGMLSLNAITQNDYLIYGLWFFVLTSLIVGFYLARQFKLQRLESNLNIDQKSRLLLRHTSIILTIMDSAAIAALLFALMGGSIWHFLGIIFIVLNCKISQYPRL